MRAQDQLHDASKNSKAELLRQYGGAQVDGWVSLLPTSWVPYVQLARLSPPAALFLIYFPHQGLLGSSTGSQQPLAPTIAVRPRVSNDGSNWSAVSYGII